MALGSPARAARSIHSAASAGSRSTTIVPLGLRAPSPYAQPTMNCAPAEPPSAAARSAFHSVLLCKLELLPLDGSTIHAFRLQRFFTSSSAIARKALLAALAPSPTFFFGTQGVLRSAIGGLRVDSSSLRTPRRVIAYSLTVQSEPHSPCGQ